MYRSICEYKHTNPSVAVLPFSGFKYPVIVSSTTKSGFIYPEESCGCHTRRITFDEDMAAMAPHFRQVIRSQSRDFGNTPGRHVIVSQ
jgi:hypothetical protein